MYWEKVFDILEANDVEPVSDPDGNGGSNNNNNNGNNGGHIGSATDITFIVTVTTVGSGLDILQPGTTTTASIFDPTQPTEACNAFSTLSSYCGDGGINCLCYSSTYYVPDQWNSLAAACAGYSCPSSAADDSPAKLYCDMAAAASSQTAYCSATGVSSVAFGAVARPTTASASASASASSTVTSVPPITNAGSALIGGAKVNVAIPALALALALLQ